MYQAIAANKRNTIFIMAAFVGLVAAIGWLVSYIYNDISIAYGFVAGGLLYALIQYFAASKLTLAMTGAEPIDKRDNPRLYRIVENIAITTGAPTPKIYIINDDAPNAFATGRDPKHSVVGVTTGLLDIMTDSELEAVMAHEMGHIQNYDIRVGMIAFGLASAIGIISDLGLRSLFWSEDSEDRSPVAMIIGVVLLILAPIVAAMIQLAVGRQREYLADATSSMTTRHPDAMVSALIKLGQYGKPMQKQTSSTAHLFISNPLKPGFLSKLFSTHPPIEDRIARLKQNANKF